MGQSLWHYVFDIEKLDKVEEIAKSGKLREDEVTLPLGELVDEYKDLRPLAYAFMTVDKLASYVKEITYYSKDVDRCRLDQSSVLTQIIKLCDKVESIDFHEGNVIADWRAALENKNELKIFRLHQGRFTPNIKLVMFPQLFRALSKCPEIEEIYADCVHNKEHTQKESQDIIPSSGATTRRCKKLKKFFVGHAHMLPREVKYLVALKAPVEELDISLSNSVPGNEFRPIIEEGIEKRWNIKWLYINHVGGEDAERLRLSELRLPHGHRIVLARESRLRSYNDG